VKRHNGWRLEVCDHKPASANGSDGSLGQSMSLGKRSGRRRGILTKEVVQRGLHSPWLGGRCLMRDWSMMFLDRMMGDNAEKRLAHIWFDLCLSVCQSASVQPEQHVSLLEAGAALPFPWCVT
jgi:hypothetical protein